MGLWLMLGFLVLIYLSALGSIPMAGDEAYYWAWSQHPAGGYVDHPPGVAWLAIPFQAVLGSGQVVFRLVGVLAFGLAAWLTSWTAVTVARSSRSESVFWWTSAMLLVSPLLSHYLVEMGPDTPLVLGWALCLACLAQVLLEGRPRFWVGAWLGIALAVLAKLTGWLLLASVGLLILVDPVARQQWRSRLFWLGAALASLAVAPHLVWNARHQLVNFTFQWGLRVAHHGLQLKRLLQLPELLTDLGVLSLVALPALLWALTRARTDPGLRLLLWLSLPVHLAFVGVRLLGVSRWNWPLPGYLGVLAITAVWLAQTTRGWLRLARVAWVLSLVWSVLALGVRVFPDFNWQLAHRLHEQANRLPQHSDQLSFALPAVGQALAQARSPGGGPVFLLNDEYTEAAALSYYSGREVDLVMPHLEGSEYLLWNHFQNRIGQDALFVAHRPLSSLQHVLSAFQRSFQSYQRLDEWQVQVTPDSPPVIFYPVFCHNLRENWLDAVPSEEASPGLTVGVE